MRACNSSMPWRARKARKNKVWWNASLGRLRKESRQARRKAQREQDQERKTALLRQYRRKKAAYRKAIKEAKISSLRETLFEKSPGDPWGLALRIVASKRRRERTVWRTIQDSKGNWAGTRKETAMALIRKYFPVDDPETDTPDNRTPRETEIRWNEEREREISLEELEKTVRERPKKKAPGIDGFPTAGLEHLLQALGETLAEVLNRCSRREDSQKSGSRRRWPGSQNQEGQESDRYVCCRRSGRCTTRSWRHDCRTTLRQRDSCPVDNLNSEEEEGQQKQ
jgi:hypothetical protein